MQRHVSGVESGLEIASLDRRRAGSVFGECVIAGDSDSGAPVDHLDVLGVQEEGAAATGGGLGGHPACEGQGALRRDFDKAAVSGLRAAARADVAIKTGSLVRPHDDLPTVAGFPGVGNDACIRVDVGARCGRHIACAPVIAADQRRAAASFARDVDPGAVIKADVLAKHPYLAAPFSRPVARGIQGAGHPDDAFVIAHENDLALGLGHGQRLDDPAHVEDVVDHSLRRFAGQKHSASIGFDAPRIAHQRLQGVVVRIRHLPNNVSVHGELNQPVAVHIQGERVAGGERHLAQPCLDESGVLHPRRHECHQSALGGGDLAAVDDHGI